MSEQTQSFSVFREALHGANHWYQEMATHLDGLEMPLEMSGDVLAPMKSPYVNIVSKGEVASLYKLHNVIPDEAELRQLARHVMAALPESSHEILRNVPLNPEHMRNERRKANVKANIIIAGTPEAAQERVDAYDALKGYFGINKLPFSVSAKPNGSEKERGITVAATKNAFYMPAVSYIARILEAGQVLPAEITLGPVQNSLAVPRPGLAVRGGAARR